MTDYYSLSLEKHEQYKWKLAVASKVPLNTIVDLSTYYTPGVAQPCREIAKNPEEAYRYTWKQNSVAIVSDGSAVLGLGNIWWLAWLPVMEGKALLFKKFADIDAVPIVLSTQDPEIVIQTVQAISPTFGWINLEDISAPNCFYIEEELKKTVNIPVFHDDQHGTAIVVLAWIINAYKITNRTFDNSNIVISWAGSAGIAIAKLLHLYGAKNIVMLDSQWAIYKWRDGLNKYKEEVAEWNLENKSGSLIDVLKWADVFVWVSKPDLLKAEDIALMNEKSIIFALSNPVPEIMPDEAKKWWAYIVATWRSDYPNQVNNVLAFPGIFKAALTLRLTQIEDKHKIIAAETLANLVQNPNPEKIIPSIFEEWLADKIVDEIKKRN